MERIGLRVLVLKLFRTFNHLFDGTNGVHARRHPSGSPVAYGGKPSCSAGSPVDPVRVGNPNQALRDPSFM